VGNGGSVIAGAATSPLIPDDLDADRGRRSRALTFKVLSRGGFHMCFTGEPKFWTELDDELLRCLGDRDGAVTPAEIGARLGMSEAAVCTIIVMLAESGKVRICSVERVISH